MNSSLWSLRLQWLAACLVFFAIPLVLLAFGLGRFWQEQDRVRLEKRFALLDRLTRNLSENAGPTDFFGHLLRQADPPGLSARERMERLRRVLPDLHRRFPGLLTINVLDAEGRFLSELSASGQPRRVLEMLFRLCGPDQRQREVLAASPLLQNFAGPWVDLDRLPEPTPTLMEARPGERGHWFFAHVHQQGALFAHIDNPRHLQELCFRDRIRTLRRRLGRGQAFGYVNLSAPSRLSPRLAMVLGRHEVDRSPHVVTGDRLYSVRAPHPRFRVWAGMPFSLGERPDRNRGLLLGLMVITLFGLARWSNRRMVGDNAPLFSIGWRLAGLFFFSGGVPMVLLLLLGNQFIGWQGEEQIRALHQESRQLLETLDQRFLQLKAELSGELRDFFAPLSFAAPEDRVRFITGVTDRKDLFRHTLLRVFDHSGTVVWSHAGSPRRSSGGGDQMLGKIVAQTLRVLNRPDSSDTGLQRRSMPIIPGTENPEMMFLWSLRHFLSFTWAGAENWIIGIPLRSGSEKYSHLVVITLFRKELESLFIRTHLRRLQETSPGSRLVAADLSASRLFPLEHCREESFRSRLRDIARDPDLALTILAVNNRREAVSAVFPRQISGFFFVARRSLAGIDAALGNLKRVVIAFSVLLLLSGVFLGFRLSAGLLRPLGHLRAGMEALRDRQFDFRLTYRADDEFGRVAEVFNQALGDVAELHVAKAVQETLLPGGSLAVGEYLITGRTEFCQETGGDFFDIRLLADQRLFFLIGDVSGHGISAAMAMSVIKGVLDRQLEFSPDPEEVLSALSLALFPLLKTRKMATCMAGLLDPATHALALANAGHCYPILGRPGQVGQEIRLTGFPLGFSRKRFGKTDGLRLAPGEALLLFTDHLFEAPAEGVALGYPRLVTEVFHQISHHPQASLDTLFHWHAAIRDEGPPGDDMTLLLLSRQPEGGRSNP